MMKDINSTIVIVTFIAVAILIFAIWRIPFRIKTPGGFDISGTPPGKVVVGNNMKIRDARMGNVTAVKGRGPDGEVSLLQNADIQNSVVGDITGADMTDAPSKKDSAHERV